VRLFLARIPWPLRLLLGPLATAGYLTAWTMDGAPDLAGKATRAAVAFASIAILIAFWFEMVRAIIEGHWAQ
jgi:hypothetical protein